MDLLSKTNDETKVRTSGITGLAINDPRTSPKKITPSKLIGTNDHQYSDDDGYFRVAFNGSSFSIEDGKYEPRRFVEKAKTFFSNHGELGQIKHDFVMKLCKMFGLSTQEFSPEASDSVSSVTSILQEAEKKISAMENGATLPLERKRPLELASSSQSGSAIKNEKQDSQLNTGKNRPELSSQNTTGDDQISETQAGMSESGFNDEDV